MRNHSATVLPASIPEPRPRHHHAPRIGATIALLAAVCLAPSAWAQDAIWGVRFGSSGTDNVGNDVAQVPDGSGDFYACGEVEGGQFVFGYGTTNETVLPGGSSKRREAFVARYRADATPVWVRMIGGQADDQGWRVATFPDGSVIVVGTYNHFVQSVNYTSVTFDGGTAPSVTLPWRVQQGGFMAKYNADGDLVFGRALTQNSVGDQAFGVVVLPDDAFVIVGQFRGSTFGDADDPNPIPMPLGGSVGVSSPDGFVARYEPNGDITWVERIKGAAADNTAAVGRMADGDLVLSGFMGRRDVVAITFFPGHPAATTIPVHAGEEHYVLRLDASDAALPTAAFTVQWLHTFGRDAAGSSTSDEYRLGVGQEGELYLSSRLAADPVDASNQRLPTAWDGAPFLAGWSTRHVLLARLDPATGSVLWARASTGSEPRVGLAVTSDGLIVVASGPSAAGVRLFDEQGTVLAASTSAGLHAKFDADGTLLWWRRDSVVPVAVTTIRGGRVIATGRTVGSIGDKLDLGEPTEIQLVAPYYRGYLAAYAVAPATAIEVPDHIARHCDPGLLGATVNFLVEVTAAPPGSRLEVRDVTTDTVLLSAMDPPDTIGVGPVMFPLGVTMVTATLYDSADAPLASGSFTVTVEDNTPPELIGCGPKTIECTGPETWLLRTVLGISATDVCDPHPEITFAPAAVPMGTTPVTVLATDEAGNTAVCTVDVTVVDTTPPHFVVAPEDIERECSGGSGGAIVSFDVLAEDTCGVSSLVCVDETDRPVDPAGTFFACGTHTVTCTATDASGNWARHEFTVEIFDNTAPVIVCPDDITVGNDPGQAFARVAFTVTATDNCDPDVPVVCTAEWGEVRSGDAFPIGTTEVVCTAQDHAQNQVTCTFHVTVEDREPPALTGPPSATVVTDCMGSSRTVTAGDLGMSATDNFDPGPVIALTPNVLAPGSTTVSVTATDLDGNQSQAMVDVTVLRGPFACEVLRPLDPNVDNRIHPGRTVPVKLSVTCGNVFQDDVIATVDQVLELPGGGGTPIENPVEDAGASNDNGNVMRLAGGFYIYNLSTAAWNSAPGTRFEVVLRVARAGHVDTLCSVFLVNR